MPLLVQMTLRVLLQIACTKPNSTEFMDVTGFSGRSRISERGVQTGGQSPPTPKGYTAALVAGVASLAGSEGMPPQEKFEK